VLVNSATFIMSGGAKIKNNTSSSYNGGGVHVTSAGDNKTGSFMMNGGEISGNTAAGIGGGVYMTQDSGSTTIFTMSGGTIYGINNPEFTNIANNSTTPKGVALYNNGGTAQYGNGATIVNAGNGVDITITGH